MPVYKLWTFSWILGDFMGTYAQSSLQITLEDLRCVFVSLSKVRASYWQKSTEIAWGKWNQLSSHSSLWGKRFSSILVLLTLALFSTLLFPSQISVSRSISISIYHYKPASFPLILRRVTQHATWRPCFNDPRSAHQAPALPLMLHLLMTNMLCSSHTFIIIIINIIVMYIASFQIPRTLCWNHRHRRNTSLVWC